MSDAAAPDAPTPDSVTGFGTDDALLIESYGPVRVVVLNRPDAYNASNPALHGALGAVWTELAADDAAGAIVVTGAGPAFSAGGDLDLLETMSTDTAVRAEEMTVAAALVRSMTALEVPVVAAVNGPAVGLGCSLAGLCDLVLVAEDAYFADPHVSLGLVAADGGALTWPLLTSLVRAKEFLFLGDRIDAETAVQIGLANRVVPAGTAKAEGIALAQRLAALPPQSLRETKRLLNEGIRRAIDALLDDALAAESASFDEPAFRANLDRMLQRKRAR